jgi:DHA2 family multidrug resistance protein-like MFS transporter
MSRAIERQGVNAPAGAAVPPGFRGNDRLLFGMILGVLTFWLFAQSTLNVAPDMQRDLGIDSNTMTVAVAVVGLLRVLVRGGMGGNPAGEVGLRLLWLG